MATVWQRKDNWVGSQIEDAFVILNFEGNEFVSLNRIATAIWDLLDSPCDSDRIVADLTVRFDVSSEQCTQAVMRVLDELEARGLIQPVA